MRDHYTACLLGGAIGDALGAAVEFMSHAEILERFGPGGISDYAEAYGGKGKITDDTQMTLFTAEGLLRGQMRGVSKGVTDFGHTVANAYLRWLATQGYQCLSVQANKDGWLFQQRELHSQRAPGMTCLSALRVAPVGLFWWTFKQEVDVQRVFEDGCM